MKKLTILIGLVLVMCLLVPVSCAAPPAPMPAPAPAPVPAPAPEEEIAVKTPENVIPLAVPGFILHEKSNRVEPIFEGEEYSAYSFFVPKPNSKFNNKVESVVVRVWLFKDDTSSKKAFDAMAQGGTSATDIQVNGTKTLLTYDEDFGETCAIQQQGRLVIYSDSIPPFEATTFDKDVLRVATIEGLKAIRL